MILHFNFAASIAKIQFTNFKRKISLNKFYLQIGKQLFGLLILDVFLLKLKNKLQYACGHFFSRQSPEQTLLILLIIETILSHFSFFSFLNPIFLPSLMLSINPNFLLFILFLSMAENLGDIRCCCQKKSLSNINKEENTDQMDQMLIFHEVLSQFSSAG